MRKFSLISTCFLFVLLAGSHAQVVLQRCDRTNLWSGSNSLTVDNTDKKEGVAALQFIETSQTRFVHLEILSLDGCIVKEEPHIQTPATVSLEELTQGMYILKLNSDGGTLSKRLIKQ